MDQMVRGDVMQIACGMPECEALLTRGRSCSRHDLSANGHERTRINSHRVRVYMDQMVRGDADRTRHARM